MFAAGPEKDRHAERDDRSKADPERNFDRRKQIWHCVGDPAEDSSNRVEEIVDECNEDETDTKRDDVADVATTS